MTNFPVVGGPLDGELASHVDFQREITAWRDMPASSPVSSPIKVGDVIRKGGKFSEHASAYVAFNRGSRTDKVPSMIWLSVHLVRCPSLIPRGEGQYPAGRCERGEGHAGKHLCRVDGRNLRWS